MEEDRAQVDLGIAVDVEERLEEAVAAAQKQPKKRFIGRRQATEAAASSTGTSGTADDSGAIQSTELPIY